MAGAEELIHEAEYAFRNIAPGSTRRAKFTARAKRLATQVIRKYPRSIEAEQARQILERLRTPGELVPESSSWRPLAMSPQPVSPSPHAAHTAEQHESNHFRRLTAALENTEKDGWGEIWQKITALTASQRKVLGIALFIGFILISAMPVLLLAFIYYAVKPRQLREHINGMLDTLA